jgi:hypothetical protein
MYNLFSKTLIIIIAILSLFSIDGCIGNSSNTIKIEELNSINKIAEMGSLSISIDNLTYWTGHPVSAIKTFSIATNIEMQIHSTNQKINDLKIKNNVIVWAEKVEEKVYDIWIYTLSDGKAISYRVNGIVKNVRIGHGFVAWNDISTHYSMLYQLSD